MIATVAIKPLSVVLEPEPLGQLDLACTLFREAARTSVRAQKALVRVYAFPEIPQWLTCLASLSCCACARRQRRCDSKLYSATLERQTAHLKGAITGERMTAAEPSWTRQGPPPTIQPRACFVRKLPPHPPASTCKPFRSQLYIRHSQKLTKNRAQVPLKCLLSGRAFTAKYYRRRALGRMDYLVCSTLVILLRMGRHRKTSGPP